MRAEAGTLTEIRRSERRVPAVQTDISDSDGVTEPGWLDWVSLFATLALLVYGCYLAWDAWDKLLQVITKPGWPNFVLVPLAIQVAAPFLQPLA